MEVFNNPSRRKSSQTILKKKESWTVLKYTMKRQMQLHLIIANEDDPLCRNKSLLILLNQKENKVSIKNF